VIVPFTFEGLPLYTRDEIILLNWYTRVFPGQADWRRWAAEIFGSLVEKPAGREAMLVQTHCLETEQPPREYLLDLGPGAKDEVVLGREETCDIVITARAVGGQHARLYEREGRYFLEDLGSSLGTFIGKRKVGANHPALVRNGDAFTIFPYRFELRVRRKWAPEDRVAISAARIEPADWAAFERSSPAGVERCSVSVHPVGGIAYLELDRAILDGVLGRAFEALLSETATGRDGFFYPASDHGIFEFLLLCLLERGNRELAFPFRFAPVFGGRSPAYGAGTRGVAVSCTVALTGLAGAVRAFLPYPLLAAMRQALPPPPGFAVPAGVTWRLPVAAGSLELTVEEMWRLEPNDILLFTMEPALCFPQELERGWSAKIVADNPWKLQIDNYFERSPRMEATSPSVDLSRLPLRLHVVLGEMEMTLGDVGGLAAGTILELDRGKSDPVRLAINGKLVGEGELVEIDGKLGVKIVSWSGT